MGALGRIERLVVSSLALVACVACMEASALADPTSPTSPTSPTKAECVAAYGDAQSLRADGKLRAAHAQLLVCSKAACPSSLSGDCTTWLAEVDRAQSTVVVEARDAHGAPTLDVRVFIDGELVAERLTGRTIEVDPGERALRFESRDGRVLEQKLIVVEGDKLRRIEVRFDQAAEGVAAPSPSPASTSGRSALGWIVGGAGVVSLGAGIILDITGKNEAQHLLSTCAPSCDSSRVDDMRRQVLVGDVLLGVGLVALAGATWILLTEGRIVTRPAPAPGALALDRGGRGMRPTLRGSF